MKSSQISKLALVIFSIAILGACSRWYYIGRSEQNHFRRGWEAFLRNDSATLWTEAKHFRSTAAEFAERDILDAAILLKSQKYRECLARLQRIPSQEKFRLPTLRLVGEALYWLDELGESERIFHSMIREQPGDGAAHCWLGAIYYDLGHILAARTELLVAIELDPASSRPHRLLSLIERMTGNLVGAIHHYREVVRIDGTNTGPALILEFADTLMKTKDYVSAIEVLEQLTPANAESLALLGECHWNLGNPKKSQDLVAQSLSLSPTNRRAMLLSARWAVESGAEQTALPFLNSLLDSEPHDVEARYLLIRVYQSLQQLAEAQQTQVEFDRSKALHDEFQKLERRVIATPNDVEARQKMAELAGQLGKTTVADFWRRSVSAWNRRESLSKNNVSNPK